MRVELEKTTETTEHFGLKLDAAKILELLGIIYGGLPEDAVVKFYSESRLDGMHFDAFELGKGQHILVEWTEKRATSETSTFAREDDYDGEGSK